MAVSPWAASPGSHRGPGAPSPTCGSLPLQAVAAGLAEGDPEHLDGRGAQDVGPQRLLRTGLCKQTRWAVSPCPLVPAPGRARSQRRAGAEPTTYPFSAGRRPRAPPAARRAGPPSPRSPCRPAAPPARATSAWRPAPPCAGPALLEEEERRCHHRPPVPLSPSGTPGLGPAPTCEGSPGEAVAGGTGDGLPGQQHALRRHVVHGHVLHARRALCGWDAAVVPADGATEHHFPRKTAQFGAAQSAAPPGAAPPRRAPLPSRRCRAPSALLLGPGMLSAG